jgi:hypothetical protein
MDVTSALLVAMMFVILLSLGIANIVMIIPALFAERRQEVKLYWIHSSWIILLFLIYLNLFWNTLEIFSLEDWQFHEYLYVIIGPVLIFIATHLLLPDLAEAGNSDMKAFYYRITGKFFLFFLVMAVLHIWIIGADFLLQKGFTSEGVIDVVAVLITLALAASRQPGLHGLGTGAAWLLFIGAFVLKGMGIID